MGLANIIETLEAVNSLTADDLVKEFGEVDTLLKALKERREDLRVRAIMLAEGVGAEEIQASDGARLVITRKAGSERLDTKAVRAILTEEQLASVTTVGDPVVSVSYKAPKKVLHS